MARVVAEEEGEARCPRGFRGRIRRSFVFKTELIADRVWRTRSQLEIAVVKYIGWYNADRLQESLGDLPPIEYEQQHALGETTTLAETMA